MPGKIDIYNLGELGVDVVKSPLHQSDGDLIQAQNAMPDPAGLEGGIRKRDGMAKVNAIALTGAIEGAFNVPLPAPGTRTYFAGQQSLGGVPPADSWSSSVGGTVFAGRTTPSLSQGARDFGTAGGQAAMTGCVSYKRRLFYAGDIIVGNESAVIRVYDGSKDRELCRIPFPPGSVSEAEYIGHMWVHRGFLYVCAGITLEHRIYKVDIVTGAITRLGEEITDHAVFGLSFLDRMWAGYFEGSSAKLRWIRNGESTWTLERTAVAGHLGYCHGVNFLGDLFVGTFGDVGTAAIVERRTTSASTWATSLTGPDTTANYYTCFAVFDGNLYCVYRSTTKLLVKKYTGSAWSTELDVLGAGHADAHPTGVLVENDALYIAFASPTILDPDGYVLRRTTAGAWSKPVTLANGNGTIGFLP